MPKPRPARAPSPEPSVWPDRLAGLAVFLAALLLPVLGAGVALDQLPTPGRPAGQLLLAVLFTVAMLLTTRRGATGGSQQGQEVDNDSVQGGEAADCSSRRDPAVTALVVLIAVGLLGLLFRRPGLTVTVGTGASFRTTFPADLEAGLAELARLGVLWLALVAGRRVGAGWSVAGLSGAGVVLAVRGLREYLAQWRGGDPDWRIFAGFTNPNQAAAVLVVLLPVAAAAVVLLDDRSAPARWLAGQGVARGSLKLRLAAGLAFVLMLLALGLTRSRGGLLAVGCGGAALALGLVRAGRPRAAAGLLAAGVVLTVLLVLGPLRSRLALGLAHSNSFRVLTWLGTWVLARHHPLLGCGLGGWPVAYPFYARAGFTQHAHNEYLQTLAETGVIGLAALLALIVAWLATAWRRAGTSETRALGLALLAATVGFAVHSALDHGWHVTAVPVALAMLYGAARGGGPAPRPRAWPAALVVILLLALWSTERHRAEAARALRDGYPNTAREALRAAVRTTPFSALAWEDLAGVEAGRGDLDAALADYQAALRRRPTSARLYYRLAQALLEAGRPLQALDESERGVALSPLHLQGHLQLGGILERLDRPAEAREVYLRLDELAQRPELSEDNPLQGYVFEPTHAFGLMRLAELSLADGDDGLARDAFTRALDQFEAYLKTYDDALASMKELDQADQLELLALRGLHPAERQEVEALVRRARQELGTPPGSQLADK